MKNCWKICDFFLEIFCEKCVNFFVKFCVKNFYDFEIFFRSIFCQILSIFFHQKTRNFFLEKRHFFWTIFLKNTILRNFHFFRFFNFLRILEISIFWKTRFLENLNFSIFRFFKKNDFLHFTIFENFVLTEIFQFLEIRIFDQFWWFRDGVKFSFFRGVKSRFLPKSQFLNFFEFGLKKTEKIPMVRTQIKKGHFFSF